MNGELRCPGGTIDYTETNPYKRAVIIPDSVQLVESRGFSTHNRYLPIPQKYRDLNDKLEQNPGY